MKKMEWSDFTNTVLTFWGKFFLIPIIILGSVLVFIKPFLGLCLIFGACFLFLLVAAGLAVFKPSLVKKFPESKEKMPIEEKTKLDKKLEGMSQEERKNIPLKSSGKYMVDRSVPYEKLSKIQKLAVDRFNGDVELAWEYVAGQSAEVQNEYTDNMTHWEARAFFQTVSSIAEQRMTKNESKKITDIAVTLALLDMTEEEVLNAEINPFLPKLRLSLGWLIGSVVMTGVVIGFGNRIFGDASTTILISVLLSCTAMYIVLKVTMNIIEVCRFRKAKRLLMEDDKS